MAADEFLTRHSRLHGGGGYKHLLLGVNNMIRTVEVDQQ